MNRTARPRNTFWEWKRVRRLRNRTRAAHGGHIVEDVSELCTRMAIIHEGRILLEAEPLRAMEELNGRIWRRVVATGELEALERDHAVISTRLLGGRTIAHVFAETGPGADFEVVEPDLEDVYFSVMAGQHGRRAAAPV